MYKAKLIGLSDSIEEEVVLDINGTQIVGFSTICPYQLTLNQVYPVALSLTFLDGPDLREINQEKYGLVKIDDAYTYTLYGKICGDSIDVGNGIKIQDELFTENSYLDGCYVEVTADRLSVEFL